MAKYYMEETELTKAITLIGHMEQKIASACDNINQAYYKICTQSGLGVKEAKNALIQHGHTIDDQVENIAQIKAALSYIIEQTTAAEEAAKNELVSEELDANLEEPEIVAAAAVTGSITSAATGSYSADSNASFQSKLEALQTDPIFQTGSTYWQTGEYYLNGVYMCSQCMAFAREAQERLYENYKNTGGTRFAITSFDEIQVGDALHYDSVAEQTDAYWGHWVLVIGKTDSGDLIVAEGNAYDYTTGQRGVVVWNRVLQANKIDTLREVIRP